MIKVYKVVRNQDGVLKSAIIQGEGAVTYKPGEWVEQKRSLLKEGMGLLCFSSQSRACLFKNIESGNCPGFEVWEATASGELPLPTKWSYTAACGSTRSFLKFLRKYTENDQDAWPSATVCVRRIRLDRKLS